MKESGLMFNNGFSVTMLIFFPFSHLLMLSVGPPRPTLISIDFPYHVHEKKSVN